MDSKRRAAVLVPRYGRPVGGGDVGEPLRISDEVPDGPIPRDAETRARELAAQYAGAIGAIASLRERIGAGRVDRATAETLTDRFAAVRRRAVDERDLTLAELAFSGELVFAALACRPAVLEPSELAFLDNVIAALRELGETPAATRAPASLDLVCDAFDRVLARLESV